MKIDRDNNFLIFSYKGKIEIKDVKTDVIQFLDFYSLERQIYNKTVKQIEYYKMANKATKWN